LHRDELLVVSKRNVNKKVTETGNRRERKEGERSILMIRKAIITQIYRTV